jgi:hypothetical protein
LTSIRVTRLNFILKVHETEQPHNLFDAGIMFYDSTDVSSGSFAKGPRDQMIFFDEVAIGWGDETETFAMDTTDTLPHLHLSPGW